MKPILFNTEMVRAILDGRKTETRRVVKVPPKARLTGVGAGQADFEWQQKMKNAEIVLDKYKDVSFPYRPGDILYVRETWAEWTGGYAYKADDTASPYPLEFVDRWHPSIHMPKEAARLFLRVTDVRAERLQEIDEHGANAEGIAEIVPISRMIYSRRPKFKELWDSTIKPADRERCGWAANPWVWVIGFERCERPEDGDGDGS